MAEDSEAVKISVLATQGEKQDCRMCNYNKKEEVQSKESLFLTQHISEETPAPVSINCAVRTSLLTPYPEMWIFYHTEFLV